jgi:hypothetical protein
MQMEIRRQAQAIEECHALGKGADVASNGALASTLQQQNIQSYAQLVGRSPRPHCARIGEDIELVLRRGGWNSTQVVDLVAKAKQYGCEN